MHNYEYNYYFRNNELN